MENYADTMAEAKDQFKARTGWGFDTKPSHVNETIYDRGEEYDQDRYFIGTHREWIEV